MHDYVLLHMETCAWTGEERARLIVRRKSTLIPFDLIICRLAAFFFGLFVFWFSE